MDKIAFISENTFIYWSPIILVIAAFAAACVYLSVYIGKGGSTTAGFISIPLVAVSGIFLGRVIHWYCRTGSYASFTAAITNFASGDFALVGVFIGCLLTAGLLRLLHISRNLPKMLDSMAIGGSVGICAGRLASLFNETSRGMLLGDDIGFPFAYPLVNPVSGETENRLATFMIQSGAAALIAIGLLLYMLVNRLRRRKINDGDISLLFVAAYSITQIVCDSTRYDALVLRSNGFVSMVQIVSLLGLLYVILVYSICLVKNTRFKPWYICFWVGMLGMIGVAGYMEYFVQNNGTKALFAYSCMSAALTVLFILLLVVRWLSQRRKPMPEAIKWAILETIEAPSAESKTNEPAAISKEETN